MQVDTKNVQSGAPSQVDRKKIQNYVYRFDDEIGKGNFSKVFKGHHEITGKIVAIKTIELSSLNSPRLLQLLNTQTSILKMLNHPNVIHCEQILSSVRNCYIVTELCDGGDLDRKLKKVGHFREDQIYQMAVDVYEGLKYLKEKHIIHRDLKVSNVFINKGKYKIADFGFAQISQKQFKDISVGSPIYMSPQGYIQNVYGPKTDVWAFGILLYELICGVTPYYDCKSEIELKKKLEKQLTISDFTHKNISQELRDLILSCLKTKQKQRISINQINNCEWMKKAYASIVDMEKQNIRKVSSYQQRSNIINLLKKNNQQLLHKMDNNSISKEEKQKKPQPKIFTQKFSNFLRLNKNQKDQSKQIEKRHNTIEKNIIYEKSLGKRNSQFEKNSHKNQENIFYSPKNQINKFKMQNGAKNSLNDEKIHKLLSNKSQIFKLMGTNEFGSGQKIISKKKEHRESNPFGLKDDLHEKKEEIVLGSPTTNLSVKIDKNSNEDKASLTQYKKYFNSNLKNKNNTLNLKPSINLERKTTLQLKSNFDGKYSMEIRKTHKQKEKNDEQRQEGKKSQQTQNLKKMKPDVISRTMSFSDCIGIIHYCRLSYKFSCILAEIGGQESSKTFFKTWTVQLLTEIMEKIKRCDILYGNQNLMNNPSMGANSPSLQKKKRLQAVTQQYLSRYTDSSFKISQTYTLKQASNLCYELYLRKAHEFKSRSKQKHPQLFFALICYLKYLDRETKNLMEYIYEVRSTVDGKAIEKLLAIKITDFNRKIVQQVIGENSCAKTPSNTQN